MTIPKCYALALALGLMACALQLGALLAFGDSGQSPQATYTVCGSGCDYTTIGAALQIAGSGDEVQVQAGTFRERIEVPAGVLLRGVGPRTVIDAGRGGSAVRFSPSAGPDTVLTGFTISGGLAAQGAGVLIDGGASPTLENLIVQGNEGDGPESQGAGAYIGPSSAATIRTSAFYSNTAGSGAAIYIVSADPVLERLAVALNRASLSGGGVHLRNTNAQISDSTFTANVAVGNGGGIYIDGGAPKLVDLLVAGYNSALGGAGIAINGGTAELRHSKVISNTAGAIGGGILVADAAQPVLHNLIVAQNVAVGAGAGVAFDEGSKGRLSFSTLVGNRGAQGGNGDAIYLFGNGTNPTIEGNIVVGNSYGIRGPTVGGGGRVPNPVVKNNDVWNNSRGDLVGVNIESKAGTAGNISVEPLFTGPRDTYFLSQTEAGQSTQSPAVDAGEIDAEAADLANRTTRTDGQPDRNAADLGYHHPVPQAPPTATSTRTPDPGPTSPNPTPTSSTGRAIVRPSSSSVAPGTTFTVAIEADLGRQIAAGSELESSRSQPEPDAGYTIALTYDPAVIAFVDARTGGLLARPGARVTEHSPQLEPGRVVVSADVELGPGLLPARGDLVVMTFDAVATGHSPLRLDQATVILPDRPARSLDVSHGSVNVAGTQNVFLPLVIYLRQG